jgi:nucleoid DNA-binding protein
MSSSSISKGELVRRLADRLGIPRADAEVAIEETVYEIAHALTAGESVSLPGLGTLALAFVPARDGQVAGRAYHSEARTTVRFRPARALRERLPKAGT